MASPASTVSARNLLDAAYTELAFDQGALSPASNRPDPNLAGDWLEKGDWQALAAEVRVEKIFFVDQEPTAVFAQLSAADDISFRNRYNRIWCMARPQVLFIARPGELAIYDLTAPPMSLADKPEGCPQLLARAASIMEVQRLRSRYHRELIETGGAFGEHRFGKGLNRADRALIRDLKVVRSALNDLKLREGAPISAERKFQLIHSLIGRAIFIRYLEDRDIITPAYFEKVIELHAADGTQRREWRKLLDQDIPVQNPAMDKLLFLRALGNKDFTYALFEQLAHDFDGDTFPVDNDERRCLLQHHLAKLRDCLLGTAGEQQHLFFYAYDFSIIPIELISSIYEEFYNERVGDAKNQGAHYTPPALVEFVLARTLTREVLETRPRVLDPACGSGIFLVEAFRRMVRHLCAAAGKERPTRQELRNLLREQIAGVDINEEAIRVAAFSLYLAFLHYQKPREILPDPGENLSRDPEKLRAIRLPSLKFVPAAEKAARKTSIEFFDTLLAANAFSPIMGKCEPSANKSFGLGSANVVVGNPPWGDPAPHTPAEKQAIADLKDWCDYDQGRPWGDKERSQAFLHLTLSLLRPGGMGGLLVSSGVFFKQHDNSKAFRKVWLSDVHLRHVVNFAHVRHVFFSGPHRKTKGISPFACVVFTKAPLSASPDNRFEYWSAKRTAVVENTKAVVMTRGDMHYLSQRDCLTYEKLWKIYWWGGHSDEALVRCLEVHPALLTLGESVPGAVIAPGRGFLEGNKSLPRGWLGEFMELPVDQLSRYGKQPLSGLVNVPRRVERRGQKEVFGGPRLLLRRGIPAGGRLTVRHETRPFCFRHSVIGFRLQGLEDWMHKVITGIYWSSLAQYYFFMTVGSWGMWHDEIQVATAGALPILFPKSTRLRDRIVGVVEKLQELETAPEGMELGGLAASRRLPPLEGELDEAVFDLYDVKPTDRDLVYDMCLLGLDLYYRDQDSTAVKAVIRPRLPYGTLADVANARDGLAAYLRAFIELWNPELAPDGEFCWRILSPPSGAPLLAVHFETRYSCSSAAAFETTDAAAWAEILEKLSGDSLVPFGSSRVFTDTFFRIANKHEMLFVKRDERRFWTKSAAREDAEAAMVRIMQSQQTEAVVGR